MVDYEYEDYCEVMEAALNTMDRLLDELINKEKEKCRKEF